MKRAPETSLEKEIFHVLKNADGEIVGIFATPSACIRGWASDLNLSPGQLRGAKEWIEERQGWPAKRKAALYSALLGEEFDETALDFSTLTHIDMYCIEDHEVTK